MISADTNLFIYAYDQSSPRYQRALEFFQEQKDNRNFVICGLMLVELYMQLRNQAVMRFPLTAEEAVAYCKALALHPIWPCVDYEPELLDKLWQCAAKKDFAFRRIVDLRLAQTLIFNGVTDFATVNVKDFRDLGFKRVWNPLEE